MTGIHHFIDFAIVVGFVSACLFLVYGCVGVVHEWASATTTTAPPARVVQFPTKETSWL